MPSVISSALHRHRWTLALGVPFVVASYWLPLPPLPIPPYHALRALGIAVASLLFAKAWGIWHQHPLPWHRFPGVLLACVGASAFLDAFMRWKAWLPVVTTYAWDDRLAAWSVALHGGHPLGVWLLPIFGHPLTLRLLDALYSLWLPTIGGVVLWQAWSPDRERAARFALAFVLTWAGLGILCAGLFLSLGPIFLAHPGAYQPILDAIAAAHPADTLATKAALSFYLTTLGVSSIAAMPSIHVAMPVLYACVARGWLRAAFIAYAVLIFLGSVMLGWHYALDGEVAALGVMLLWWLTGHATRRNHSNTPAASFDPLSL